MIDLKQKELKEWQERNFPRSRYEAMTKDQLIDMILAMQFTLGMAEEVGEVAYHILKGIQAIRGGINGFNINQIADGVVDSGVFGQQLLSHFGVDSEKETSKVIDEVLKRDWKEDPSGGNMGVPIQQISNDKLVEVCDKCSRACCWYGEFMCDDAYGAGTKILAISELKKLENENEHYWSDEYMIKIFGEPAPFGYKKEMTRRIPV